MNLFRNKKFTILALATTISSFGDSLYALAITLSVYNFSGSLAGVAGMWLIRALIRIPCQFISGIIVDKYNRKRISVYIYMISAGLVLAFMFIDSKLLWLAFVLIFILQGTSDVDNMSQMAIMSEVIDKEELTDANNVFQILGTVVTMVGPGVGGMLYLYVGEKILYFIDAGTFLLAAIIMLFLPYQHQKGENQKAEFTLFRFAKEGILEIRKLPVIKIIITTMLFFGILGRFYEIDKIYVADNILNIGAEGIVFFTYAMNIGSLLAPAITKVFQKINVSEIVKFSILSILFAGSFILWGNATVFSFSILSNVLIGMFETSSSIFINVIFQSQIDKKVMGRVMAFYRIIAVISSIIGIILAPILVDYIGVNLSMTVTGMIAIVFCILLICKSRIQEKIKISDITQ